MDLRAVVRGAIAALVALVGPAAIVRVLAGSPAPDAVYTLYLLLFLASFALGGGTAAVRAPDRPLTHAAAAGAAGFAVLALGGLVALSGTAGSAALITLLLLGQVAVSLAMLGGFAARRRLQRRGTT